MKHTSKAELNREGVRKRLHPRLIVYIIKLVQLFSPRATRIHGRLYRTPRSVFNPRYFVTSRLLAEHMHIPPSAVVLDMGCGCGIQAITAAGAARRVVAVDIAPAAVACTQENIRTAGLEGVVEVYCSDLFSSPPVRQQFDAILFNPPYLAGRPATDLERALLDEKMGTLRRFLHQAHRYLKPGGTLQVCYSSAGNLQGFLHLACKEGWDYRLIARRSIWAESFGVYQLSRCGAPGSTATGGCLPASTATHPLSSEAVRSEAATDR